MPNSIGGGGAQKAQNYYSNKSNFGNYQYISLVEVIDNFTAAYTGEGKILQTVLAGDVSFHAHRALQELNYDTLKSVKTLELEVCPSLMVPLPHDFVNYVKFSWSDLHGVEHVIYPTRFTSNPFAVTQIEENCTDCGNSSDSYQYDSSSLDPQEIDCEVVDVKCAFNETAIPGGDTLANFGAIAMALEFPNFTSEKAKTAWAIWKGRVDQYCLCLENSDADVSCGEQLNWDNWDTSNITYGSEALGMAGWQGLRTTGTLRGQMVGGTWPEVTTSVALKKEQSNTWDKYKGVSTNTSGHNNEFTQMGKRYGLEPQLAQSNGSYFIDEAKGMIHFGSSLSGRTIIIKYISDGVSGDEEDIMVPKLAEEAIYKWIAYGCASARIDVPEGVIQRLKKERFAETRKAKIRLSNIKIEEIAQIMRGKAKFIDH